MSINIFIGLFAVIDEPLLNGFITHDESLGRNQQNDQFTQHVNIYIIRPKHD